MTSNTTPRLFAIFVLWLIGLGTAAQFGKISIPFEAIQQLYPNAGANLGWVLTIVSLTGAFLGLISGSLIAKIGLYRALVWSIALGALCSAWQAMLPSFSVMLLSRFVEGFSHLAIVVAAPTLIAEISPLKWRGAAMALWSSFFGVAFAGMTWWVPEFVAHHGLDDLFWIHAGYFAAMVVLLVLIRSVLSIDQESTATLSLSGIGKMFGRVLTSPSLSAPAFGWLCYTLTFVSILTLTPQMLPADQRVAISTAMPLMSIAVALGLVPFLLTRWSSVQVLIAGFVASAAMVLLILIGVPMAFAGLALFATLGLVQSASFSSVPELVEDMEDRALSNGAMAQMGNLGNLLGTPILLFIMSKLGENAGFVAIGTLYLIGAAGHIVLARLRQAR